VDDLMGVADIELTSADGLRLANLDGVTHDYEVRLPSDEDSTQEESHMLVTAVVSVRMTLVASEPAEEVMSGERSTPNRMVSVNRRVITSSTFDSASLRDSSIAERQRSVDDLATEGAATPSGQSHKSPPRREAEADKSPPRREAEAEGVKGRASLSSVITIAKAKVAKLTTALSMQSVVNNRGVRCAQPFCGPLVRGNPRLCLLRTPCAREPSLMWGRCTSVFFFWAHRVRRARRGAQDPVSSVGLADRRGGDRRVSNVLQQGPSRR